MAEKLVIVESPTKARTISKMLGGGYKILASMGHVRDLPEHAFGVDIKQKFNPLYTENPRSKKILKELRSAAKNADEVFLAPDPDREGEAIAWHLSELLKSSYKGEFKRVTFHEITKSAINKAFEHTSQVDMDLVDAQQARRVLDRIVGYMVSPLLWSQIAKGISAGRVQSVALRLIVEREREILGFKPEEYWNFSVILKTDTGDFFEANLFKINREAFKISNETDAIAALDAILGGKGFEVAAINYNERKRSAPPPFTTSTLQQAANNTLGFSATNSMRIAQQLYEGLGLGSKGQVGLITYMRTDSVNVSREAQEYCRNFIGTNYGQEYVPAKPNFFKSKSGAQEAHEAIRPTDVNLTPESVEQYLDKNQFRLYTLIWRRFVASQMSQNIQRQTAVDIDNCGADGKKYTFRANAMITIFPGFVKVYDDVKKKESGDAAEVLGRLKEKQTCELAEALKEQKFTEPPPRFNEASLIKELEANGIGRPSTYATILRTIQAREYVSKDKGKLIPSELGFKVNDFLVGILPDLFQVDFTSKMEAKLDDIEAGDLQWTVMMEEFYSKFAHWLKQAKEIGAPETGNATDLLALLDQVKWEPGEKRGRRVYDDNKFFTSIKEKFMEDSKISAKQWQALLKLAAKYQSQLPELKTAAENSGFAEEMKHAAASYEKAEEDKLNNTPSEDDVSKYKTIFSAFDTVKWEPAQKSKGRSYDDEKFFKSLEKQAFSGKMLSDKQLAVLKRFAAKYKEFIPDFEQLCGLLDIDQSANGGVAVQASEEVLTLIEALSKVTTWAEPVGKGKRTYDDKAFFESLSKQVQQGRTLSPKQLFALKKLAGKYTPKDEE